MNKPQIVQAADAVAYLPLYVAERGRYELALEDGTHLGWDDAFDPPFRSPPEEYLQGVVGETRRTGDLGCLAAIEQAWRLHQVPLIGICDPCSIVDFHKDSLVIVGGFIRRACFWCLTDDVRVRRPEDLSVSHLFIHEPGFETGHKIGREFYEAISKRAGGPPDTIQGVFELLIDGAVWLKRNKSESSIAAISASILSCVLATKNGFNIAFPLYELEKYHEFLSTAIVVHREAIEKREDVRRALTLLLLSLKDSTRSVTNRSDTIEEILRLTDGTNRFANERLIDCARVQDKAVIRIAEDKSSTLAPVSASQARAVWESLRPLYSTDCSISETEWQNAWHARGRIVDTPKLDSYFDRSIINRLSRSRLRYDGPIVGRPIFRDIVLGILVLLSIGLAVINGAEPLLRFAVPATIVALLIPVAITRFGIKVGRILRLGVTAVVWILLVAMVGWLVAGVIAELSAHKHETWPARLASAWHPFFLLIIFVLVVLRSSPFIGDVPSFARKVLDRLGL